MGPLSNIFELKDGIKTKRISSYDRTGGNDDKIVIKAGETAEIANISGAGIIKHIWITISTPDNFIRRNAIIRMYWDGEENPSVESPLGDFFGQGWGEEYNFASLPLAAAPAAGKALNSYFPMPFGDGARITIENQSEHNIDSFYYYVDYEEHPSIPDTAGRFHAWWNRELTEVHPEDGEAEWGLVGEVGKNKSDKDNYLFADIEGKGHFVGVNYYVDSPGPMWYGEGDDMFLVDGEDWPGSLHGTGTEDFFNSSWCPNEEYIHPYFGYAKVPDKLGWMGRTHCYRFLLEDPIYFDKSLRASIEHGHNNNLTLDISTVSYWYQTEPHKPFPELPGKDQRQNMPEINFMDVHRWRHEWRKAMGNGKKLWGNEIKEKKDK
ncbi:glycoside hydrolase family 172 protein [Lederbergia graminis]|uniref:Glycoside hydrolase family 172 protein n=1 Tax=Lederbergia graminis TaxID=735518 RepID=A0ABW0LIQ3_9BACI